MLINQSFDVDQPIDQVWKFFYDIPLVAACIPGADLTNEVGEDQYEGDVIISAGPVKLEFSGAVKIKEGQIALLRERRQIMIQDAVTRGLNPATPLKDSGIDWIGQIPAHWDVKPLLTEAKIKSRSGRPDLQLLSVYLGLGVVKFDDIEEKRTNATSLDLSAYQIVEPGDLVLNNQQAWRGSVGVSFETGIVSPAESV